MLTARFDQLMAGSQHVSLLEQLGRPTDLPSALVLGNDTYAEFRDAHEERSAEQAALARGYFLGHLVRAVRNTVLERQPEWRELVSSKPPFTKGTLGFKSRK